jgi:hypothetical protein
MGRRGHKPDPTQRRQVEAMAAYGTPEADIGRVIGVDPKTLRKHYREELDLGETKANAQVAGYLFNAAKNGNVTAQIFWLKTRAKWRETPVELRHSGSIGRKDLRELSDEELLAILHSAGIDVNLAPAKTIDATATADTCRRRLSIGIRMTRMQRRVPDPRDLAVEIMRRAGVIAPCRAATTSFRTLCTSAGPATASNRPSGQSMLARTMVTRLQSCLQNA